MNDSSRRQAHTYNPAIKLTFSPVFPSLRYSMAFRKPSKGTCVFYHSCGSDLDSSAFVEQPVQRFVVETTSSAYIVCVIHRVASSATCLRRDSGRNLIGVIGLERQPVRVRHTLRFTQGSNCVVSCWCSDQLVPAASVVVLSPVFRLVAVVAVLRHVGPHEQQPAVNFTCNEK